LPPCSWSKSKPGKLEASSERVVLFLDCMYIKKWVVDYSKIKQGSNSIKANNEVINTLLIMMKTLLRTKKMLKMFF
jgi:hypothetical protein